MSYFMEVMANSWTFSYDVTMMPLRANKFKKSRLILVSILYYTYCVDVHGHNFHLLNSHSLASHHLGKVPLWLTPHHHYFGFQILQLLTVKWIQIFSPLFPLNFLINFSIRMSGTFQRPPNIKSMSCMRQSELNPQALECII